MACMSVSEEVGMTWSILTRGSSSDRISLSSTSLRSRFLTPLRVTEWAVWLTTFGSEKCRRISYRQSTRTEFIKCMIQYWWHQIEILNLSNLETLPLSSIRRTSWCSPHLRTAWRTSSSEAWRKSEARASARSVLSSWWSTEECATVVNSSRRRCLACRNTQDEPWGWLPHRSTTGKLPTRYKRSRWSSKSRWWASFCFFFYMPVF